MNTETATTSLDAFRAVDFDWAMRLQDVWQDPPYDVPQLHGRTRAAFGETLQEMGRAGQHGRTGSPLGWVLIGPGGSGKTHLLGAMRREAVRQEASFVLVDMTDVRNFWDTVLQGYLDSLQSPYADGMLQVRVLLERFLGRISAEREASRNLRKLASRPVSGLVVQIDRIVDTLRHRGFPQILNHQDVVRAVVCLNSRDTGIVNAGYNWLQGQEIDEESKASLGFQKHRETPRRIVKGLSWFMSLSGPSAVAFDQLDPIVHQVGRQGIGAGDVLSDEQRTARAIIEQIGGGLAAMRETTSNTLSLISCVETTWQLLNEMVLSTYRDRFEAPIRLQWPREVRLAELLIQNRLAPVYQEHGWTPPYPTWPFTPQAVATLAGDAPREILKSCEDHRKACIEAGEVTELTEFHVDGADRAAAPPDDRFARLDERFEAFRNDADPESLREEQHDDERLAPLYQTALQCLIHEHDERLPTELDAIVESEFSGGATRPLHARLRLVFHQDNSREEHYCVRTLQRNHARAYQARLKAAMTQSGIDRALKFRHLTIVRNGPPPGGPKTQKLTQQFLDAGGKFHEPTEEELRTLFALQQLQQENAPDFKAWLRTRSPVTRLNLHRVLAPGSLLDGRGPGSAADSAKQQPENSPTNSASTPPPTDGVSPSSGSDSSPSGVSVVVPPENGHPKTVSPPSTTDKRSPGDALPLGQRILGLDKLGEVVSLPVPLLSKHTIILGGSGSGKSVTVRRLVEEATLLGIPTIVIDCAQDMPAFDERWPEPSPFWRDGDAERAEQFHARAEMVVWTPGRDGGNPLTLEPIPDLGPVADDPEELESAVQMLCGALGRIVAPGQSQSSKKKEGLLAASLRYFARHFPGGNLQDYIDLLSELPGEAGTGVKQQEKFAGDMADALKTEQATNPLLRTSGTPLDPAVLFGDDGRGRDKTRISVVSLVGLKTDAAQQYFLNQLAMLLFSWIKKNPHPPGDRPLRGLLVIDEAKDYVPSRKRTECKESLMRLAAQARKYRLGLVLATQHPKDIETKIVGNCATHLYGLNNSPASLDTLQDLMSQKGGSGTDIPKLKTGEFYVHNADAGHKQPIKIKVPMSLSLSPKSPLEEPQILGKARASRTRQFPD